MHYEDIKAHTKSQVLKLAAFLGEEYHRRLVKEPELLYRVLRLSSIIYMKDKTASMIKAFTAKPLGSDEKSCPGIRDYVQNLLKYPRNTSAMRKGLLGDWRNHFTGDMNARIEKNIFVKLSGTEFLDLWKSYGIL
ncbi:hypothetical protein V5799_000928 [Amblyomma americanum]|uniref:Sulfotransferase domain-containing protein n=1 Tax=Amblyomma americanum TaxID=6943 RepID=A0AAQ4D1N4_AMBAM